MNTLNVRKDRHKTAEHNSETCTRESLPNTSAISLEKKIQEFALGDGVIFHILFKSDETLRLFPGNPFFCVDTFNTSLKLEMKRFDR